MGGPVFDLFFEGSVLLVDIEVIPFIEIIGHIDIRPQVFVEISDHDPQTETDQTAIDPRFLTDVGKSASVVAQQHIAHPLKNIGNTFPVLGSYLPLFGVSQAAHRNIAVI